MGNSFRGLAKTLGVTSTEVANAALIFYRQGLTDEQVFSRVEWATKLAKVSGIDIPNAADLITSTMNGMDETVGDDVQRVVDMFVYLGDHAATSAEEVAGAFKYVAATAENYKVEMEFLGAALTTVLEQRLDPSIVGNAFKTIFARMHSIANNQITYDEIPYTDENGFYHEEGHAIARNKVEDALWNNARISLQDKNGKWKETSELLKEVAARWNYLNDVQKSNIATVMAGTRQQEAFFAIISALSDEESNFWELYNGVQNAYGTTSEKYKIWQDSVAGSSEALEGAFERLYANLNPDLLEEWNRFFGGFIDLIGQGTSSLGGMNVILGLVVGGLTALTLSVLKTGGALTSLGAVWGALKVAMMSHPILMGATAFLTVATVVGTAVGLFTSYAETQRQVQVATYNNAIEIANKAERKINSLEGLRTEMDNMFASTSSVSEIISQYSGTLTSLAAISPEAEKAIIDLKNGLIDQAEAAVILNTELEKALENEKKISQAAYRTAAQNLVASDYIDKSPTGHYSAQQTLDVLKAYAVKARLNPIEDAESLRVAVSSLLNSYSNETPKDQAWWLTETDRRVARDI